VSIWWKKKIYQINYFINVMAIQSNVLRVILGCDIPFVYPTMIAPYFRLICIFLTYEIGKFSKIEYVMKYQIWKLHIMKDITFEFLKYIFKINLIFIYIWMSLFLTTWSCGWTIKVSMYGWKGGRFNSLLRHIFKNGHVAYNNKS